MPTYKNTHPQSSPIGLDHAVHGTLMTRPRIISPGETFVAHSSEVPPGYLQGAQPYVTLVSELPEVEAPDLTTLHDRPVPTPGQLP